jgi:outer membrane receptor protein involved in Fe transport
MSSTPSASALTSAARTARPSHVLIFDYYTSAVEYKGNPDLRRTQIFNYDLRVEHFPGLSEILAVSFFYKEFEDPIETTIRIAGGGLVYQPANGRGGRLYGTEIEGRLRLERLSAALRSFRAGANLTFVESETKLPRTGQQTSSERPLAGQSPYVVNLMLFYEPEGSPLQASAVYNVFGERLDKAGVGVVPDIYEKPRHSVDATVGYTLGGLGFKLAVENILNDDILFEQGFDEGEEVITKYRTGRSISLGVSRSL